MVPRGIASPEDVLGLTALAQVLDAGCLSKRMDPFELDAGGIEGALEAEL